MSSHREAPEISKDPAADSTDLYAFMSPDKDARAPSRSSPTTSRSRHPTVARTSTSSPTTCSTRSISTTPATASGHQLPVPLHHREQHPGIVPLQRWPDHVADAPVALVPVEPPTDLHPDPRRPPSPTAGAARRSSWDRGSCARPATSGRCRPRTTRASPTAAIHSVGAGPFSAQVFAGQRAEGFYVDLGAVFDLGDLRGFAATTPAAPPPGS